MLFDNLLNAFGPMDSFTDRKIAQFDELMAKEGIGPERATTPAKILPFPSDFQLAQHRHETDERR